MVAHKKRKLLFILGFIVISFSLSCVLTEVLLRLVGFRSFDSSVELYFWVSDKKLGFKNKANGSYLDKSFKSCPLITTDKNGFRNGYGWSYGNNNPIILILGDSTVFSSEVGDENTGSSELAKILSREMEVKILNAGVRGYSTVQVKRMLENCIELFPGQIKIVVYVYCANDYWENIFQLHKYAVAPIVRKNYENGLLEIIEPNLTVPHGQSFEKALSYTQKVMLWLKSNSVVAHKVILCSHSIMTYYDHFRSVDETNKYHPDEVIIELMRQMNNICNGQGIVFLSTELFTGDHSSKSADYNFPNLCKRAGVSYVNIKDYFVDKPSTYMAELIDGTFDPHYGVKGTKTFAKGLSQSLKFIQPEKGKIAD